MQFTQTALDEIESVLDGSLLYGGAEHARKVRNRLERLFHHLDEGVGLGMPRPEVRLSDDIRFIPAVPYPFIVVFDRQLHLVLRVIYARSKYTDMVVSDWHPV